MWPIDHAASLSFDCTECKGPLIHGTREAD
jgi:hypothetical protein